MKFLKKIREWICGPDDYYEHIEPMSADDQIMVELCGSPVVGDAVAIQAPAIKKPRKRTVKPIKKPAKKAVSPKPKARKRLK